MADENDQYLNAAFIKSLHAQVVEMKGDVASTAAATQENTATIRRIDENTKGMVEAFSALEGGFKVLNGLGRLAKPIFYIVSLIGATLGVVAAWKGGFK